jgi:hypothetical protein
MGSCMSLDGMCMSIEEYENYPNTLKYESKNAIPIETLSKHFDAFVKLNCISSMIF